MLHYVQDQKGRITSFLKVFLGKKEKECEGVNHWGRDLCGRLYSTLIEGKMIRGGLVFLSYEMFGGENEEDALKIAAAMELFQTAFLIHDDIMDRDTVRRNQPSLFYQYRNQGMEKGLTDSAYHFGESMGICAGDIGFFFGFEILSELKSEKSIYSKLLSLYSKELSFVVLGQMQDIYLSNIRQEAGEKEILGLYRYKTARYTFSLPLLAGAILAFAEDKTLSHLERLGEDLGIIFQIKDDELGLFGSEQQIGKPIGADLKEGKMTLAFFYLLQQCGPEERQKLEGLLGKEDISPSEIEMVKAMMESKGVREKIKIVLENYVSSARESIKALSGISLKYREMLEELLEYNIKRTV